VCAHVGAAGQLPSCVGPSARAVFRLLLLHNHGGCAPWLRKPLSFHVVMALAPWVCRAACQANLACPQTTFPCWTLHHCRRVGRTRCERPGHPGMCEAPAPPQFPAPPLRGYRFRGPEYRSGPLPIRGMSVPDSAPSQTAADWQGLDALFIVELFTFRVLPRIPGEGQSPADRCCHRPAPDASVRCANLTGFAPDWPCGFGPPPAGGLARLLRAQAHPL
jgi:hypothetical protein